MTTIKKTIYDKYDKFNLITKPSTNLIIYVIIKIIF